ncbi:hypothetical protein BJY04DRAFT_183303 [Aspergillus karnatakaensis]|uniref:uncharacterized protein n=1 Tax=Aspergillus karnatakaensis TaxID=1810916 RepID=UPI003CCDD3DF
MKGKWKVKYCGHAAGERGGGRRAPCRRWRFSWVVLVRSFCLSGLGFGFIFGGLKGGVGR